MAKSRRKHRKLRWVPALLIFLFTLVLEAVFVVTLFRTDMLPVKYLAAITGGLLLLDLILLALEWSCYHYVRFFIGLILSFALWFGMLTGINSVKRGVETIKNATEPTFEYVDVGIYVADNDQAQAIQDAAGYTFGILATLDRENTDEAIEKLNSQLGTEIKVAEYPGIEGLADALLKDGEIQAILINSAYIGLYTDLPDYKDVESKLRKLEAVQNKHEITINNHNPGGGNFVGEDVPSTGTVTEENAGDVAASPTFEDTCFLMYISGIDNRGDLIALSRSDVNIVTVVNTATKQMLLINTPRDFFVPLPISNGVCDKLTHAGIYGIDCCVGTMEMLYETDIDYYFRVNFSGFEGVVDALGGVTVYSEYSFTSTHGKYDFVEGYNEVNGAQALGFARERYAFASGDRQRGKNQMELIKAMAKKALSPAILTRYSQVLDSMDGCFETTMPYSLISGMVKQQLDCGAEWTILSYSVDGVGDSQQPYSLSTNAYVMVPTQSTVDKAMSLIDRVKNGEILTEADVN